MMENMGQNLQYMMDKNKLHQTYQQLVQDVLKHPEVVRLIKENEEKLNPDMIERSYAKLYEFVQEKKKFEAKENMLAPGYEPQLSLGHKQIDVIYTPTPELVARQKELEIKNRVRSMDIPKDIRSASLEKFE